MITNKIIPILRTVYTNNHLKMEEIECSHLSTDDCKMIALFIGKNPESYNYGTMKGIFSYKDGRIFEFHWNIHTPNSKHSHLSNQMTSIQEVTDSLSYHEPTTFGHKAFWLYTPTNTLESEDYDLRILINKIKKWVTQEQLCAKFRKTDKQHKIWECESTNIHLSHHKDDYERE